jgi:hypothetical protein
VGGGHVACNGIGVNHSRATRLQHLADRAFAAANAAS